MKCLILSVFVVHYSHSNLNRASLIEWVNYASSVGALKHGFRVYGNNTTLTNNSQMANTTNNTSTEIRTMKKGYLMCGSNKMTIEIIKMIWQIKYAWKSKLLIAIAHCGEIKQSNLELLRMFDMNIIIVDVCKVFPIYGMGEVELKWRLRGFFCKVAGLLQSPFQQTLLVDLDVIWLKNPELLFNTPQFIETGALYFRDRAIPSTIDRINKLKKFFEVNGIVLNHTIIQQKMDSKYGISLYWRILQDVLNMSHHNSPNSSHEQEKYPLLNEYQDSSVVLFDSYSHPVTMQLLSKFISPFDLGYGDKEIYWIVSTLSNESFAFSPYHAGHFGDCHGVILHFDPEAKGASPFYLNAEYFVEDVTIVGEYLTDFMTSSIIVTYNNIEEIKSTFLNIWPPGLKRGNTGCVYKPNISNNKIIPNEKISNKIIIYVLYMQWLSISLKIRLKNNNNHEFTSYCMPIRMSYMPHIHNMFEQISRVDCGFLGCPEYLYNITSFSIITHNNDNYCLPITFH
eukprot:gene15733-21298_t